jgi:hypothetical protein
MGGSNTGLVGTIGFTLLNPDGTVHTARATAGIYEIGGGCYGKNITFSDNWKGSLKWDTGGGSPVYAVEEYDNAMLDEIFEGTLTVLQGLRLFLSVLAGKSAGGGGATITMRDNADSKDRITATVDANGNRTAMTLDGS